MEKEIKMTKEQTTSSKTPEKLSYEQLEQIAASLNQQCKKQQAAIQELQRALSEISEIDTLLKIIEKGDYFSEKFVARCSETIESLITKALDSTEKQEEKNK